MSLFSAILSALKLNDERHIIIQIIRKKFKQHSPYTFVAPAAKTSEGVFPITVIRRQIALWRSSSLSKNSVDKITCLPFEPLRQVNQASSDISCLLLRCYFVHFLIIYPFILFYLLIYFCILTFL